VLPFGNPAIPPERDPWLCVHLLLEVCLYREKINRALEAATPMPPEACAHHDAQVYDVARDNLSMIREVTRGASRDRS